jgi:hypothetical protein
MNSTNPEIYMSQDKPKSKARQEEAVQPSAPSPGSTYTELEAELRKYAPGHDPAGEPLYIGYFRRQRREAELLEQIHNGRLKPGKEYTRAQLLGILSATPGKHRAWGIEGLRVLEEMDVIQVIQVNNSYKVKSITEYYGLKNTTEN